MNFDEVAAKWDTKRRIERAKVLAEAIYNKIGNGSGLKALEIGCGTGLISFELNNKLKEIYCTDISKEMLKVLNRKIEKANIKNIHTLKSEDLNSEELCGKFDVIYSSMVFHHIIDIEEELIKLHKLLKKDGILIIIDLDKEDGSFHKDELGFDGHNGFERSDFKNLFERCDFKDVAIETVYEGEKETSDKIIDYSLFICSAKA